MAFVPAQGGWLKRVLKFNVYLKYALLFVALYGATYLILTLCGAPRRIALVNGLSVLFMAMPAWGLSLLAGRFARYGYRLYFLWVLFWVIDFFAVCFTTWRYGLPIESPVIIEALSNTNAQEVSEYITDALLFIIPLAVLVPILAYLLMRLMRGFGTRLGQSGMRRGVAIFAGLVLIVLPLAYHTNNVVARADPVTRWAKFYKEYRQQEIARVKLIAARGLAWKKIGDWEPKYSGPESRVLVYVIGESSNRWDWSLFGYNRKTTPLLDAMRDRLVLFKDTVSSFGSTDIEITRMLTGATHKASQNWEVEPDVIDLAKAVGYKVFWLSNQNDFFLNTVFGKEADYFNLVNHGLGQRSDTSLDEKLFPEIAKALDDPARLKLIIVHAIGSHQHYSLRYPEKFAVFDNVDDDVSKAMAAKWWQLRDARNEYDNTILYTDYFLSSVIGQLDRAPVADIDMLFVSDHAQDVGHLTNAWGHQFKLESGFTVPMLLWSKNKTALLEAKSEFENRPYQTDELDWTLLPLLGVSTRRDQPQFDLLGPHYKPWQRIIDGRPYIPGKSHVKPLAAG